MAATSSSPAAPVLVKCHTCKGNVRFKVHAEMPVEALLKLLDGDRQGWPGDWAHWPVTAKAHAQAFGEVCRQRSTPPDFRGRGIVICAGGWRFLPGLYVTVRLLRWLGCTLPVQAWYLGDHGEYDPCFAAITRGLNVEWVDAHAVCRERGIRRRCLQGWELKPLAVKLCPWREVLSLDADCYPTHDPTLLFEDRRYRTMGAIFWPDLDRTRHGAPLEPGQWERFGLPDRREPDFESGQLLIDKVRGWHALCATDWLNDHSDYVYQHLYGDKSTWHIAWRATQTPYVLAPPTRWHNVAFLHHNLDGTVVFVHRCRDKWRLGEHRYRTAQRQPSGNVRDDSLAHEWFCHQALADYEGELRPLRLAGWRPDTDDEAVWREAHLLNVYQVPERFEAADVIVDVGAHIGCFALLCLERGAGHVHAIEPSPTNQELLVRNLAAFNSRSTLYAGAAWPCAGKLTFHASGTASGFCTADPACGQGEIPALAFDDLVRQAADSGSGRVRFLKLDCEGAEWELLASSQALHLVDELAGEYHQDRAPEGVSLEALQSILERQGFTVALEKSSETQGYFFGKRQANVPPSSPPASSQLGPLPLESPAGLIQMGHHSYASEPIDNRFGDTVRIGHWTSIGDGLIVRGDRSQHALWDHPELVTSYHLDTCLPVSWPRGGTGPGIVRIGSDVWIGSKVLLVGSRQIGDGAIIGAGAVVSRNVPPYAVAVGNPAVVKRYRYPPDIVAALLRIQWWEWSDEVIIERAPYFRNVQEFVRRFDLRERPNSTTLAGR
jgi:FkbM family methyltransferase